MPICHAYSPDQSPAKAGGGTDVWVPWNLVAGWRQEMQPAVWAPDLSWLAWQWSWGAAMLLPPQQVVKRRCQREKRAGGMGWGRDVPEIWRDCWAYQSKECRKIEEKSIRSQASPFPLFTEKKTNNTTNPCNWPQVLCVNQKYLVLQRFILLGIHGF